MPLEKSRSRAAISRNIATEVQAGKPQKQAVAIAMREAGMPRKDAMHAEIESYLDCAARGDGAGMAKHFQGNK
jgi:hypothetical protein